MTALIFAIDNLVSWFNGSRETLLAIVDRVFRIAPRHPA